VRTQQQYNNRRISCDSSNSWTSNLLCH